MSYRERYLIRALVSLACVSSGVFQELRDPSPQEVALVEWASGIDVAACGDAIFDNITNTFRSAFSEVLNKYCQNITACHLQKSVTLNPGDIMLLEGYPRREYNGVRLRFVVILPAHAITASEQRHPLLSKEVIFNVLSQNQYEMENRMQMYILDFERFPRFDATTEFMNTAVIPIGFLLMVVMFGLAYWTSTLTSNRSGGGAWSAGNCKVKTLLERRSDSSGPLAERQLEEGLQSVKVIENLERKKKRRFHFKKLQKASQKNEYDDEGSPAQLVRQNAVSSTYQAFANDSLDSSIHEADVNESLNLTNRNPSALPGSNKQRLAGLSRKLSSFEEVFRERKRRKTRRGGGGSKRDGNNRWKSTSMALGGFRPTK